MRYLGSKGSVVERVYNLVNSRIPSGTLCDPFGGVGTVGTYFKRRGYRVCTGDFLFFAHCFLVAKVQLNTLPCFSRLREFLNRSDVTGIKMHLNSLQPRAGWITRHYASERHFFTPENATKIDAVAETIQEWMQRGLLSDKEHATLLASLINSADRVANTAGTYYAYLKHWYRKAVKPFRFEWVTPAPGVHGCHAHFGDAAMVASLHPVDVLYLDPPYNDRSYDSYYHLPQTIALGYRGPVRGKAGIPSRPRQLSRFCVRATAPAALSQLLDQSRWRLLVFHYSDGGLISSTNLRETLSSYGQLEEVELRSKGYSTTSGRFDNHRVYVVEHA